MEVFNDLGCVLLKHTNTIYDDMKTETFTIKEGEPNTAKVSMKGRVTLRKEYESADQKDNELNQWDTRVQTSSEMWSDEQFFYLKSQLTAWHNGETCFDKIWTKKIQRFYV